MIGRGDEVGRRQGNLDDRVAAALTGWQASLSDQLLSGVITWGIQQFKDNRVAGALAGRHHYQKGLPWTICSEW